MNSNEETTGSQNTAEPLPTMHRVRFYGVNDYALFFHADRLEEVLASPDFREDLTLEDAIELHECWMFVDCGFRHARWNDDCYSSLLKAAKTAKNTAYRVIGAMEADRLSRSLASLDFDFIKPFWRLAESSKAFRKLQPETLSVQDELTPEHIRSIMSSKKLVEAYGPFLKKWIANNPEAGIPIVLQAGNMKCNSREKYIIPKQFTNDDLNNLALKYLECRDANSNYFRALANKNAFKGTDLSLKPSVRARIEIADRKATEALFSTDSVTTYNYGVSVELSPDQIACHKCSFDGHMATFTFGRQWLGAYTDNATIMNNLAFVFEFIGANGSLATSSKRHHENSLFASLGVHLEDEYPTSIAAFIDGARQIGYLALYDKVLKDAGTSIEEALEWFFNTYIYEEFGISGFRIDLPSEHYKPMERCSLISIQIEHVLKCFTMLANEGTVSKEQLKHETLNGFHSIPSLLNSEKYAYENGAECINAMAALFERHHTVKGDSYEEPQYKTLFEWMMQKGIILDELDEFGERIAKALINDELIAERPDGTLKPTSIALVLRQLWKDGSIPLPRLCKQDRAVVEKLADKGFVSFENSLFTTYEADYLSFVYHDRNFSNALALRNLYVHSPDIDNDPYAGRHVENYLRLLVVLIDIALKINDELVLQYGGVDEIDFVDWPLDETNPDDLLGFDE